MTLAERQEAREIVRRPGKYEGENPIVPLLMEWGEGEGIEDGHTYYVCIGRWILWESSDGFVVGTRYKTRDEAASEYDRIAQEIADEDSELSLCCGDALIDPA